MTSLNEWINLKIKDEYIHYFEYDDFDNVVKVGEGAFGIVNRADWKSVRIEIALKILANPSVNEDNMNKFLKELKNLRKVSFHSNINRFYGVTKDPSSNNYMMVLQYANQGNLREYLKNNFNSLQWNDKIQMALDIACGLRCLHSKEIIHRDLHAKNILVHNKKLMIADLGLSKQLTAEVTSNSTVYGMPAYVEPQYYKNDNYVRDKRSDIYSLGVLLWELTSGNPPFSTIPIQTLIFKIASGSREQPIIDTPSAYITLYEKCWDDNPNLRPKIDDVFAILEKFSSNTNSNSKEITVESIKLDIDSNIIKVNSQSQSSISTNTDNIRDFSLSQIENQISTPLSSISLNIEKNEKELSNALDEIIQAYLKHNKIGRTKSFNFDNALDKYRSRSQEIFNYLINNLTIQNYEVIIGKFYFGGFGIDEDKNIAFELYMKASQQNDINGHFEVGYYYHKIGKNYKKAFEFYQLATNNGLNTIALYNIAFCYEYGYGIKKDLFKAFELYKKSAENGFITSQYHLAYCYKCGYGTQKNLVEALKWYKKHQENDGCIDVSSYSIEGIEKELEQKDEQG